MIKKQGESSSKISECECLCCLSVMRSSQQYEGRVLGMIITLQMRKINSRLRWLSRLLQINNCLSGMREHYFDVFQKLSSLEMANDIKYRVAQPKLPLVFCACTLFWVLERKLFSFVTWLRLKLCLINEKSRAKQSYFYSSKLCWFLWKFPLLPSKTWF